MTKLLLNIFAIEVPEATAGIAFRQSEFVNSTVSFYDQFTNKETLIELPGNCINLFTTKHCSEAQARSIVEEPNLHFGFKKYDYRKGDDDNLSRFCFAAISSLESLLRSCNLDPNKNYLLIKKVQ